MIFKRSNGREIKRYPKALPVVLTNISELLTLRGPAGPRRGPKLRELGIIRDAAVLCVGGRIVSVGTRAEAKRDGWLRSRSSKAQEIDCEGSVVSPGFVDAHTHPAFVGSRLVDFERRTSGASYEEIAKAGGGILSSVEGVRKASTNALAATVLAFLQQMAKQGTTTVETKSGYGLNTESEIKSLEAIRAAAKKWPGTVLPTFLGAHVVPPEFKNRSDEYVRLVCEEMIPQVAKRKLAQFVDVFCERGAFTTQQSKRILTAGAQYNLGARAHVCQLHASELRALSDLRPASLDHLDCVSESDLAWLAQKDTVATLVPGSNYFLGAEYPPARKMIDAGVAIALATDFNPGTSPTLSMPFVLSLACTQMSLTPAEAISAATINGAWSLRVADRKGSIEVGKDADLAIFNVGGYREIPYWIASQNCWGTVINGEMIRN